MGRKSQGALIFCVYIQLFACSNRGVRFAGENANDNSETLAAEVITVAEDGVSESESPVSKDIDPAPLKGEEGELGPTKKSVVTSITISLEQVAKELGLSRDALIEQTGILASFMRHGVVAQNFCNDENDPRIEKLCSLTDTIHDENPLQWVSKDTSKGRKVLIRPKNFSSQQKMGYGRLMRSISREPASRILQYVPKILSTTTCPRNLSAVAIRKLESLMPDQSVRPSIEKLYEHTTHCLKPEDEAYEITHLRQALLRTMWKNEKGALDAIRKAVIAKDSSERSRVLYWAGRLEADLNQKAKHWDRLIEQYPLSFHALEVWREKQADPFEYYTRRPALGLERIVVNKDDADEALRWIEALYLRGHVEAAQRLTRWVIRVFKNDLSNENVLYVSSLRSIRGTQLNYLTYLTRQVNENGDILNFQTLKMLFPRPYLELFERVGAQTDAHLLHSVARQESGFDPTARSHANARGLLQILPSTARILSGKKTNDLYDTEVNAQLGSKFMAQLIDKFGGSVELALAGYNSGPGNVPTWKVRYASDDRLLFIDLIPFKETRNYVSNIFRNNYWYERLYSDEGNAQNKGRSIASVKQKSDYVLQMVEDHVTFRDQMRGKAVDEFFQQSTAANEVLRGEDASEEEAHPVGEEGALSE